MLHSARKHLEEQSVGCSLHPTQGQRRKIVAVYLNPSSFKHIGDGHTVADQINEVLEPYDLACIEASNDRIGGWQLIYQMLQTGEWQIADTCPRLIEADSHTDAREHAPTESVGYVQVKCNKLHERAPNSKTNWHHN